jgi:hypothetical protein
MAKPSARPRKPRPFSRSIGQCASFTPTMWGTFGVHVYSPQTDSKDCRSLAAWLLRAADWLDETAKKPVRKRT